MSSFGDKIWLRSFSYLRNKKVTQAYVQIGGTIFVVSLVASFVLLYPVLYPIGGFLVVILGYTFFPATMLYFGIEQIISVGNWWLFLSGYVGIIGGSVLCLMWFFGDNTDQG